MGRRPRRPSRPAFSARFGPTAAAAGFALLALPGAEGQYWNTFLPGVVVLGVGMGLTVAPLTTAVMTSVDAHHAGAASGVNNAVSRAASVLAVAVLGVILVSRFDTVLADTRLAEIQLTSDAAVGRDRASEARRAGRRPCSTPRPAPLSTRRFATPTSRDSGP